MGEKNNQKKKKTKAQKVFAILELAVLLGLIIGIPLYFFLFQGDLLSQFESIDDVVNLLNQNLFVSSLIYLGLMLLQILVSVLPLQVFQIAAGFVFGIPYGTFITLVGAFIGTTITFWIARLLGKNAVHTLFDGEKLDSFTAKLNSKGAYTIIFLVYLIPGIPKDLMSYAGGISDIKYKPFILFSLLGRTIPIVACMVLGAMTYQGNYTVAIIILVVALAVFGICIIKRKQVMAWLDKLCEKLSK